MTLLAAAHLHGPHIDYASLMPFLILGGGGMIVLLLGILGGASAEPVRARIVPFATVLALVASIVIEITRFTHPMTIIAGALRVDQMAIILDILFAAAGIACVLLSLRGRASNTAGHGEYHALLLFSVMGMAVLVSAVDTVTLFLGFELLSIPLYVLCASEFFREGSLESGLKYLVIGSVGSATLLYGLALIYGATGHTDFSGIANGIVNGELGNGLMGDPMLLTGVGLTLVGFAFKASIAPFHQWTPDVYEGAPTPITAFMAVATKAAALGVLLRFFDVAVLPIQNDWAPAMATIAAITIIVGNVGALSQSNLKRLLGYSGVAQAGYVLAGVIVGTQLGIDATIFYLIAYLLMNMAAFAVIVAVQNERADGDEMSGLAGLGARSPWLAWAMTIAMLSLSGIPGTVGFIGKLQLIHALVDGAYTWLAIVLVIGSMISLGYYLRVIAVVWMRAESPSPGPGMLGRMMPLRGRLPAMGGGAPEADAPGGVGPDGGWSLPSAEVVAVAVLFAAATVGFGIFPSVVFHLADHAGRAFTGLLG
ncbi:MAG TPA: NADH-quinone oxidoreductase subunit N [Solirubrobacteraceae bacterium]|nr:NADH-quinone oxidoreductase subunit N [Solirubrobacteraceae bacterium]